ncbi:hypothetical protein F5148DRAFT_1278997 [Russula earlei]|uniref:Uncharacterized protein n=1 Tax=Russula earlei TaxID=71964 RepID=A0ACC0UPW2_9AGAM|nr:hypothetical protein F5148DRAFT_1278997 [Russula earlei]
MVEPILAIANFLLPQSSSSSRSIRALHTIMPRLLSYLASSQPDRSHAQISREKGKGKAALGDDHDHALFESSNWLHIAHRESSPRIPSAGTFFFTPNNSFMRVKSDHPAQCRRARSVSSSGTMIFPSARHGPPGIWKRRGVRCFSSPAQAVQHSDTGQTRPEPPSAIIDRLASGAPLPNPSQRLVDLKAAWGAFVELRKQPCPPQPSVVIDFVDRALSAIEGTLVHRDKMRELLRWSVRLRRALRQLGDFKNLPSAESDRALCLWIRVQALLERFDDVAACFHRMWDSRPIEEAPLGHPELMMVETVLQALLRHRGPVAVLNFIVSQYTLGRLVNMSSSRQSSRAPPELSNIAFRIFDRITSPVGVIAGMHGKPKKEISFTGVLLIKYLIRRRAPEDALAVCKEMRRQSVEITPSIKLWLVRTLVREHAVEQANTLFSEISASVPFGYENGRFLATALYLFANQGDVARSEAAFRSLEEKDLVDNRAIGLRLLAHAHNGDVETAVRYFHEHFPRNTELEDRPDIFHYTAILIAHAKADDSAGLGKWLRNMIADGVEPDRHVYNILLEDRAQRGMFEDVASIIDDMRIRQLPPLAETYTTVITALAKRGDPVTAEAFYKKAVREGVKPDRQMIASLMTAHSEVGSWKGVIRAFDYLSSSKDRHLRPRIDVYNVLLQAYVLAGSPFEIVSDIFQKMEHAGVRPTVHTFSILIKSACDSGQMDVAMRVFIELDSLAQLWETGIKMNVYALTIIMGGYLRLGDRLKAKEIYDEMLFRGIMPTSVTYGLILRSYVTEDRRENIQLARDFIKSLMESSDQSQKWLSTSYGRLSGFEHIYSPLMTLFARKARPEQVEELMDDMARAGGKRTLATLTLLLNAYRNAGEVDECRRVWDEILPVALRYVQTGELLGDSDPDFPRADVQRKANVICVPLSIHMDALSAAGEHAEVAEVWKTVRARGFALDSHNWNHLIVVLRPTTTNTTTTLANPTAHSAASSFPSSSSPRDPAPRTPLSYDDEVPPLPPQDAAGAPAMAIGAAATRVRRTALSSAARASVTEQLAKELRVVGHPEQPETQPEPGWSADQQPSAQTRERATAPDFAHPLHILQQILPSWDASQPHAAVVTLLMNVLGQLEVGRMVPPVPPRRLAGAAGSTSTWQGTESEATAARALLEQIHASCPRAVTLVREYEYRIRVRRELARMLDE